MGSCLRPADVVAHGLLAVVLLISISGCLLVVSTRPTPVNSATIVILFVDQRGGLVAGAHVVVRSQSQEVLGEGTSSVDGRFRCDVDGGSGALQVSVVPPAGFERPGHLRDPLIVELSGQRNVTVNVTLARLP
jgi:hypothetical protein